MCECTGTDTQPTTTDTQPTAIHNFREAKVPDDLGSLGIVPREWGWRPGQQALAQQIVDAKTKIVMLEAECGSGKSIIPQAAATAVGANYFVLIQTINLQQQYLRDFSKLRMIMGRRNYRCNINNRPADIAPCTIGASCSLRGNWRRGVPIPSPDLPECDYFHAKARAALSEGSIHNYAYWLGKTRSIVSSFARADWIICDEAHEIDQILMDAAACELSYRDLRTLDLERPTIDDTKGIYSLLDWVYKSELRETLSLREHNVLKAAKDAGLVRDVDTIQTLNDLENADDPSAPGSDARDADGKSTTQELIQALKAVRKIKDFLEATSDATSIDINEWVTIKGKDSVTIKPIYGKYGFRRIVEAAKEKVILMSAFLGAELLIETLGLDPKDVTIIKAPKVFDRTNSPIYYTPVHKYTYNTSDRRYKHLSYTIDRISNMYARSKGLVHTPSVRLRNTIVSNSRKRQNYIAYDGESIELHNRQYTTKDVAIDRFVKAPPGKQVILIGQSISTGLDLPHVPKFQVIPKLWFAALDDPAIQRRKEVDKAFYIHFSICQLVQAVGRIKRTFDDGGPTFILDESFQWFWAANREAFPQWFKDALVYNGWKHFEELAAGVQKDKMLCGIVEAPGGASAPKPKARPIPGPRPRSIH